MAALSLKATMQHSGNTQLRNEVTQEQEHKHEQEHEQEHGGEGEGDATEVEQEDEKGASDPDPQDASTPPAAATAHDPIQRVCVEVNLAIRQLLDPRMRLEPTSQAAKDLFHMLVSLAFALVDCAADAAAADTAADEPYATTATWCHTAVVTVQYVEAAVERLFPADESRRTLDAMAEAVDEPERVVFPTAALTEVMKGRLARRQMSAAPLAGVALAMALEYVCAKTLELSVAAAHEADGTAEIVEVLARDESIEAIMDAAIACTKDREQAREDDAREGGEEEGEEGETEEEGEEGEEDEEAEAKEKDKVGVWVCGWVCGCMYKILTLPLFLFHKCPDNFDEEVEKNVQEAACKHKGTEQEEALLKELYDLEVRLGEEPTPRGSHFQTEFLGGEWGTEVDPNGKFYFDVDGLESDIEDAKIKAKEEEEGESDAPFDLYNYNFKLAGERGHWSCEGPYEWTSLDTTCFEFHKLEDDGEESDEEADEGMTVLNKGSLVVLPRGTFYGFVLQIDSIEMSGGDIADVSFDVVDGTPWYKDPWTTEDKSMTEARIGQHLSFAAEHSWVMEDQSEEEYEAEVRATVASWTGEVEGKSAKRR